MELRPGLHLDDVALADYASRYGIELLALYGSALGDNSIPPAASTSWSKFQHGRTQA